MSFDWKKLDRHQRERDARLTPVLGAVWLIGGVVMLAVGFLTDHLSQGLVSALFWVVLGAATLAVGITLRKRTRRAVEQVSDEPTREPGPSASDLPARLHASRPLERNTRAAASPSTRTVYSGAGGFEAPTARRWASTTA